MTRLRFLALCLVLSPAVGCVSDPAPPAPDPVAAPKPPSELYPMVSPLVGGNSFASVHSCDYDIARDPNEVPAAPLGDGATVTFRVSELSAVVAPADPSLDPPAWSGLRDLRLSFVAFGATTDDPTVPAGYWTLRVPGPFVKVVANRSLTVVLDNPVSNKATHSIDFHAAVGDDGGPAALVAKPGERATLTIRPTHPGLFVYRSADAGTPRDVTEPMNAGMVGMILVLPGDEHGQVDGSNALAGMLAAGASEHYVFESDVFRDDTGELDASKEMAGLAPDVVTYNGRVGALIDHPLVGSASQGSYVVYHGASGSHVPSFRVKGAVFDDVWQGGDVLSPPTHGLETVLVPAAGTAIVAIRPQHMVVDTTQGSLALSRMNVLVDDASAYLKKGALGLLVVTP